MSEPCGIYACQAGMTQYPFLSYAAQNWGPHTYTNQENVRELAVRFLHDDNLTRAAYEAASMGNDIDGCHPVTGLHLAAMYGLQSACLDLINEGSSANSLGPNGNSPLHFALMFGHIDVVKMLVAREDVAVRGMNEQGETPLSLAAEIGDTEVVKLLLSREDVVAVGGDVQLALISAARKGKLEVVKLLLRRGSRFSRSLSLYTSFRCCASWTHRSGGTTS
jgi:ankyrin repeat protein